MADADKTLDPNPELFNETHEESASEAAKNDQQEVDSDSPRTRKPTEKMRALQEQEQIKREEKFHKAYEKWKQQVREVRMMLKQECTEEDIGDLSDKVETRESSVLQIYNDVRSHGAPAQEVKRRMDACSAVTNDLRSLMQHRIAEVGDEWDVRAERLRLHSLLDREYAQSVYGSTVLNPSIVGSETGRSYQSGGSIKSSIITKKAEAEIQLAGKEAELQAMDEEEVARANLEQTIESQKREIRKLETQREIKVTRAKVNVYNRQLATIYSSPAELSPNAPVFNPNVVVNPNVPANANVPVYPSGPVIPNMLAPTTNQRPTGGPPSPQNDSSVTSLAQAIQTSMMLGRLPLPEPTIFNGDPLQYTEWKASFMALIDSKSISPQEKFYFLKKYAGKEAGKAIQGFFLTHTTSSYRAAWQTLEDRYGNPFTLQKAFREKLSSWSTISPRDAEGLREYADFLQGCQKAIPQIPSLQILNDCMENQRLMNKLPSWASTRWNRQVTRQVQATGEYPNFDSFVEFVVGEAKVACNPVSSLHALSEEKKPPREPKRKQASVMATSSQSKDNDPQTIRKNGNKDRKETTKNCPFCESEGHYLPRCPDFCRKSLDERRKFVQEQRRCYGCLRVGHGSKTCKQKHTCETCKSPHPTCLHDDNYQARKGTQVTSTRKDGFSAAAMNMDSQQQPSSTSTVVPVWVSTASNPCREKLAYALLDTQSNVTFIDRTISEELHALSEPVKLKLTTMTDESDISCERVSDLRVRGYTSNIIINITSAYTREHIPVDHAHIPTNDTAKNWSHLRNLSNEIPPLLDCDVGLLIGYNCSQALAPREVITGNDDEPFAIQTDLGWSIVGRASPNSSCFNIEASCHRTAVREAPLMTPNDALRILEKDFQDVDSHGKQVSQEDIQFLRIMEKEIKTNADGHLQMPLPFKHPPSLSDNHRMADRRLCHLRRKLEQNPTLKKDYTEFMTEIIKRGDAEMVSEIADGPAWYIPHHGVYHARKNKLRVVFDCSAKFQGKSLNDHLLAGPDLTNNLVGVLCRFRQHPIAIMCDIEKMFHQFLVNDQDRDYLRFLWYEDGDFTTRPRVYRMKVHLFGASSSPGCANYGLKYLAAANESTLPLGANFVQRNFYVDDGLTSEPTEERAIQVIKEARALCAKGGLRLHKFISNSHTVMERVPLSERASNIQSLDLSLDDFPMERALGMQWSVEPDTIHFSHMPTERPLSRRSILSTVASLYDPLGLIAPYLLQGKMILQDMCRKGIGWDDPPPEELRQRWEVWKLDLEGLENLIIPRCYYPEAFSLPSRVELHHFSDASMNGYGTCSYMRVLNARGNVHCSLIAAKARVSPTKILTIPRLELSAALVSAEVSTVLKDELDVSIDDEFFWTDSQVVLGYLNNEARRFHTFVANRVQKIRQLTNPQQWHYVPTDSNPADYASRGLSTKEIPTTFWFSGPTFLWKKELDTPEQPSPDLLSGDPEVRSKVTLSTKAEVAFDWNARLSHCSTWNNAKRAVARIMRLRDAKPRHDQLSADELRKAELIIIKGLQQEAFPQERKLLSGNIKTTLPRTSKLNRLDAFLQDGIIRVGGRLRKAPTSIDERHPTVLPGRGHIANLIIDHHHKQTQHQGKGITQNEIRSHGYWILGGGSAVAKYIYRCVTCRKARRPKETQRMADLPKERLEPSPPFMYTGMDCFGPFITKNGRKEVKRYGLLFTCFCSRAIHLEMIDDLSTDSFINGLRCFISVRGTITQIRSDQGTNFIGAKNALKAALKELDTNKLQHFLANKQCEFVFNAPGSSHAGGIWERQIRSVRNILEVTTSLCPGRLDDSSLRTLFYEAMAIVNSRPLTVNNINDPTMPEPLTPNHILTMKSSIPLPPPGNFIKEDVYLRKRWRRVQFLTEQFWARWKQEYIRAVAQRQKWHAPRRNLMVGDIALITDHVTPRNTWPLGRVTETTKGDDGLVRKVKLIVGSSKLDNRGRRKSELSVLERPVQKVIVLLETE